MKIKKQNLWVTYVYYITIILVSTGYKIEVRKLVINMRARVMPDDYI